MTVLLLGTCYDDLRERKRWKHIHATALNTAVWFCRKEVETDFSQPKVCEIARLLSMSHPLENVV